VMVMATAGEEIYMVYSTMNLNLQKPSIGHYSR